MLPGVKVIVDVGARDTTYPIDYPEAVCHLFEPNHKHFETLVVRYGDNKNVILNNYGLGDKGETLGYDPHFESCVEGANKDYEIPIRTLDSYMEEHGITRIDLLKIDTEGMDFKVLKGATKAVPIARYIQYEYWNDLACFHDILEAEFDMNYIGERNVFCTRRE